MFALRSRALSLSPRLARKGKQLRLSTGWLVRVLSLGSYARSVHVDGEARYLYVHQRSFWFWVQTRIVPFKAIARICYDFAELPTGFDRWGRVHDTVERFEIALELKEGAERVPLATFAGAGIAGDLATLLSGDDLLDLGGTQEADSLSFVKQLVALTGLGLGRPLVHVTDRRSSREP